MTTTMILASAVFVIAYAFIVSEKIDRVIVAMGGGAVMALLGFLDNGHPFESVDWNTLGLLISMMVIVMITARTGLFQYLSIRMVRAARGEPWKIMVLMSVLTAVASAFLDNVTTILLVLPITLDVCRELKLRPVPMIITQVFASNIGGTATLIGDPPNIMIGSSAGLSFTDFLGNLTPVILLILPVTILAFLFVYRKELRASDEDKRKVMALNAADALKDKALLARCLTVLAMVIAGFMLHGTLHMESSVVAMTGAVVLALLSGVPTEHVLKEVEWKTIFFFTGLFMMVGGIERAGVLKLIAEKIVSATGNHGLLLGMAILWVSAILSAFVDNIPFTATMIPLIKDVGALTGLPVTPLWWALSLGACLGGNGTIIGASANVVASGMAEDAGYKIGFGTYFRTCFPVMLLTVAISTGYLYLRYFM